MHNSDGDTSYILQWVKIPTVPLTDCWAQINATGEAGVHMKLTNSQICAGVDEGGKGKMRVDFSD